ncbi:MAG: N-acetylmuramic acid 6-phosphate etherase [Armatimonadota bacterium]
MHTRPPGDYGALGTEQRNPRSRALDRMSTTAILRLMNDEDRRVPEAVRREIPRIARAVDEVVRAIRAGGRVIYVGAGTSGRIGLLDALEWPPTFGVSPDLVKAIVAGGTQATIGSAAASEDDRVEGRAQVAAAMVSPRDVVVGIAASGMTPFVLGAAEEARERGAPVIGLSNVPGSPLATMADVVITPAVGAEVLTGSTRLKAGTSQKLVLNMISTAAMVRLGKVYSNLMVDMTQGNRKLADRARRMVAAATGLDPEASARILDDAGGNAKVAIVMALRSINRGEAEEQLRQAGGHVSDAVGKRPGPRRVAPRRRRPE